MFLIWQIKVCIVTGPSGIWKYAGMLENSNNQNLKKKWGWSKQKKSPCIPLLIIYTILSAALETVCGCDDDRSAGAGLLYAYNKNIYKIRLVGPGQTDTKLLFVCGKKKNNIKRNSCVPGGGEVVVVVVHGRRNPYNTIRIYNIIQYVYCAMSGTDRNICHASDAGGTRDYCPWRKIKWKSNSLWVVGGWRSRRRGRRRRCEERRRATAAAAAASGDAQWR